MLTIQKTQDGSKLTVTLAGRLDTGTAPEFDTEVAKQLDGIDNLTLDIADVEYISSAGLRVIMASAMTIGKKGSFAIINANESVRDIFEMTGLLEVLNVK